MTLLYDRLRHASLVWRILGVSLFALALPTLVTLLVVSHTVEDSLLADRTGQVNTADATLADLLAEHGPRAWWADNSDSARGRQPKTAHSSTASNT